MRPEVSWAMRPTGPLANIYLTDEQTRAVYGWLDMLTGYILGEAEAALRQLETDMRNWSSDETRAVTDVVPDLTADSWIWAQRGVGRAIQVIHELKVQK